MFYFLTVVAAIAGVVFGCADGVIAAALPTIEEDFPMSALVGGFMTVAVPLGALCAATVADRITDRFGRRPVLMTGAIAFAVAALIAIWVLVVFTFPAMLAGPGLAVTFAIFAAICLGGADCTVLRPPETTNRSLEAIEAHLISGCPLVKL